MSLWNLVYITSNSHSGSTLLDMLLGSHSRCLTLGEIHKLTLKSEGVCACGADNYRECLFWADVNQRLLASSGLALADLRLHTEDPREFQAMNRALFAALQAKTGCSWFVDSSKKLARLKLLLADPDFNVIPIHIVRRPEGVVCSNLAKGRPYRDELRAYYYDLWNRYKFLQRRPHLLISYERLCSQPEMILGRIMQALGLEFEPSQLDWSQQEHHNVNGNKRTRTSRHSAIRLDERWRRELTAGQRLLIALAQFRFRMRLLLRLGLWPRPL